MSNVKVGDKVRCTTNTWSFLTCDELYEVTEVGDASYGKPPVYVVDDDGDRMGLDPDEYEAVSATEPRYTTGMQIKLLTDVYAYCGAKRGDIVTVERVDSSDPALPVRFEDAQGMGHWPGTAGFEIVTVPAAPVEPEVNPAPTPQTATSSTRVVYEVKRDGNDAAYPTKHDTRQAALAHIADATVSGTLRVIEATERVETARREVATVVIA